MLGFNGGLLGTDRTTSTAQSVPGIWTLGEQVKAKRSLLWPASLGEDPYFANVSLLLKGDGTNGSTAFVDSSSNNFAITPYGNAQISTAQSKFGGASMYFDGSGDYLTSAAVSDFEFGSGDFTVECWIYFNSIIGLGPIVVLGNGASGNGTSRNGWSLLMLNSTQITFYRYDGAETNYTFPFSPALSTWYHVAVSRSATSLRCFINGSQVGSTVTTSVSYNKVNDQALHVGRLISGSGDSTVSFFNGYIDDLRITKGVARYTANFIPPGAL